MDIVIPLGTGSEWNDNDELRYCLRSFEKNLKDLGNVYIVGHKPAWLQNIKHIEYPDTLLRNKDGNLIAKVMAVCSESELTSKFIRLSDDQLLLKQIESHELKPYYIELILPEHPISRWKQRLKRAFDCLQHKGLTSYNYESHIPMIVDKLLFPKIMMEFPYYEENGGVTINTPYFNTVLQEHKLLPSVFKESIEDPCTVSQLIPIFQSRTIVNYNNNGFNDDLKAVIKDLFPNKSKFEL